MRAAAPAAAPSDIRSAREHELQADSVAAEGDHVLDGPFKPDEKVPMTPNKRVDRWADAVMDLIKLKQRSLEAARVFGWCLVA